MMTSQVVIHQCKKIGTKNIPSFTKALGETKVWCYPVWLRRPPDLIRTDYIVFVSDILKKRFININRRPHTR